MAERLITTVSSDTTDRTEAWRTVAYMAIDALTDFCKLLETLKQMTAISAELEGRDLVQVKDIRQVGHHRLDRITRPHWFRLQIDSLQNVDNLGDLDMGQKRVLICCELERTLSSTWNTVNILLCESAFFHATLPLLSHALYSIT